MTANLHEGVVIIELDGETRELEATPGAAMKLSRLYGGLTPILGKLQAMDIEAYANVIRFGLGMKDKEASQVHELIFRSGIVNLMEPTIDYITCLFNGGRVPGADSDPKGAKKKAARGKRSA